MGTTAAGELILAKTLRDGKTTIEFRIEPETPEPDTLAYWLTISWGSGEPRRFKAGAHQVANPPAPGITHAINAPGADGLKRVTIGLTAAEAAQIEDGKKAWVKERADRKDAEREALAARVRAAAPGAPTWSISSPHGAPAQLGETVRDHDGRAVTGLKTWHRYYAEDGMSFGASDDAGYVYFTEVREATPDEAARLEAREAREAARAGLAARGAALAAAPDAETPGSAAADLRALPGARIEPARPLTLAFGAEGCYRHLRADEPGGLLWVLTYNGADGDDWSRSNYGTYIARRMPFTPERRELFASLAAEFGPVGA